MRKLFARAWLLIVGAVIAFLLMRGFVADVEYIGFMNILLSAETRFFFGTLAFSGTTVWALVKGL